jgi:ABC transporter substrate binding protein
MDARGTPAAWCCRARQAIHSVTWPRLALVWNAGLANHVAARGVIASSDSEPVSRSILSRRRRGPFPEIRRDLELAAQRFGVRLSFAGIQTPVDIDKAIAQAKKDGASGIIVPPDVITGIHREHLAQIAVQHRLPSIYWQRTYVETGGLMSYGFSTFEVGRHAAVYVDKILRGAKPAELPVEQPTRFDIIINAKTAKALGLTIPPSLLLRADQVIE